ncbi:MAG: glycogen/starch synthase, ADP-glucose type [candidate division WWE3 bacterium GW2011_GWA2_46_9]|uniref:Glycogen synthase n=2 Tax=Katanobacteria TaxID=422282 RepID=A0A0G1QT53_UNCKA|nr:MAG: glycogen/starch synthase, ADP-glucose type [candidate division WWE3 bacterium GW2011_GWA2_46_9]
MKVLLAASEVAPIVKLGGLGDVMGSLPKALEKIGVNVDVVIPFYPSAKISNLKVYKSLEIEVPFEQSNVTVEVFKTKLPDSNVDVFLLRNPAYFSVGGKTAFANNISESKMFAFFDKAVVELLKSEFNTYDIVHCNDWHTGFVTHLLEDEMGESRPRTLLTIHNLSYQGVGPESLVRDLGVVPGDHQLVAWDLDDNKINFLLQGITSSDYVSTVSPSYASEILFKDVGGELSEILQSRKDRLTGILNGIDYTLFKRNYDVSNWKQEKPAVKKKLQKKLNLTQNEAAPLFSFISRLDPNQKGLDILFDCVSGIVELGGQFVLLGTGDPTWENKFLTLADNRAISISIDFDVDLANEIYEGADFILVPSKYEPCGLTQMIGMHYGTLPVVHGVGGLKDTVTEGKTGFVFNTYSVKELQRAINRACAVFKKNEKYDEMVSSALKADFSWKKSAAKYKELYERMLNGR